jgi:serine protease
MCDRKDVTGAFGRPIVSLAIILILLGTAVFTGATAHAGGPPFRDGEIVVAGAPGPHLDGLPVIKYLPNADLTVVEVERGREFGMVQRFENHGRRAGLNFVASASATANDPLNYLQWHFTAVQSEAAWDISKGTGVIVAVLDTGLATAGYEDGISCTVSPWNVINNDSYAIDGNGHGTHVAGTISQKTNNSVGVAGLAYEACVMPVKVLNDSGNGSFADIADGIVYAVNNGADVINMSLGTNALYNLRSDPIMDPALNYAYKMGVTLVAAAGNDGSQRNVSYPAIYNKVISVGATDFNNNVTSYSNRGKGLDLVAPGGDIYRDDNNDGWADGVLQETFGYHDGWAYYFFQGTSMATPHVAAAAALLIAADSTLTPDLIYEALTTSTKDLNGPGYDRTSGYGLLQVYNALTRDQGVTDPGTASDVDGDGWAVENGDCDDNDPHVYPGHHDTKGKWGRDGVDNDCNGLIDG